VSWAGVQYRRAAVVCYYRADEPVASVVLIGCTVLQITLGELRVPWLVFGCHWVFCVGGQVIELGRQYSDGLHPKQHWHLDSSDVRCGVLFVDRLHNGRAYTRASVRAYCSQFCTVLCARFIAGSWSCGGMN
jgi:hypothetical protein